MKVTYFAGGILQTAYRDFETSVSMCLRQLGVDFEPIHNWSDIGDDGLYLTDPTTSMALVLRNLAIGEKTTRNDLIFCPDPQVYQVVRKAVERLEEPRFGDLRRRLVAALGIPYTGRQRPVNILHLLRSHTTGKKFDRLIMRRLASDRDDTPDPLRVVVHTPPELLRPERAVRADTTAPPHLAQSLLEKAGARCLEWASATRWAGGSLPFADPDTAVSLAEPIVRDAHATEAEAIVTLDPRALRTIDRHQADSMRKLGLTGNPLPVMYVTDLLDLAMGISATRLQTGFHATSCEPVFTKLGLQAA
ncbi:hypothetical protein IIA16_03560 [bacterium]|nr:hypothetical protein [bacterium]